MSLSLATLDAVGRMKLDPVLRRTGAGELGTDTLRNDVVRPFTGPAAVLTEPDRIKEVLDGPLLWTLDKVLLDDIPPGI